MLIAIDARESGTTTGRYIDKLIENIANINPNYDINILTKTPRLQFVRKIAPTYYVHSADFKEFTFDEQLKYLKFVQSVDADLVHFGMTQQPIFYKGNVITTIHDLTMTKKEFKDPFKNPLVLAIKQPIYKLVVRIAANKSKAIIVPSNYTKNEVMKFTKQPAHKFSVTYEAADKIKEKPDPIKKLVGKQFLMYIGRPMPHKNLTRLIEAYEILLTKYPDLYLVLAGPKDIRYEGHEKNVKAKGLKNVIFTDYISDAQLRWLYENCAAYVFPSLSEGFGLPGLEAMVHGAPVVSSKATCLPEIYGEAAQYFDPLDIDDMADNITKVLSHKDLREELIKKGYAQAAKYSWKRMAEQTLAVYDKVLRSNL